MSNESRFVMMATLPIEYRYENMHNGRNILANLAGYIGLDARNKDEFIQEGLNYLDSFCLKAEAYQKQFKMNFNDYFKNYKLVQEVQTLIDQSTKVDREEFVRLLSAEWDKNYV